MLPALFAPTIHQTCQEKIGIIVASDTNLKCILFFLYFLFSRLLIIFSTANCACLIAYWSVGGYSLPLNEFVIDAQSHISYTFETSQFQIISGLELIILIMSV
jgi:hypothetical protein